MCIQVVVVLGGHNYFTVHFFYLFVLPWHVWITLHFTL